MPARSGWRRKRAAAVAGRLPKRFREVVASTASRWPRSRAATRTWCARCAGTSRSIDEQLDEGRGIWFTGDVGTGKTTLAMLVSKAAMEAERTVAIYSLPRLLAMLRDTYDDDARYSLNELIDRLCSVDLLHIDDVGAEQTSAWVLEQLYTIVNTRYEDGRAMLLTTNLVDDETLRGADRRPHRLASDEICGEPLPLFGDDPDRLAAEPGRPAAARTR